MTDTAPRYRYAFVLALALTACESPTRPTDAAFGDDRTATRAAFQQARGRWSSVGISDYDYDFRRSCFCAPPFTAPVRITVRSGHVTAVVSSDTGAPLSTQGYPSVDDLFGMLQEALDSNAYAVRVTYDAALGYPTRFYIDRDTRIADEELAVETSALQPGR
jgi:hypothetical protein